MMYHAVRAPDLIVYYSVFYEHACLQLDGASLHFHAMCILRLPQTNSELVATVCFAVAVNGDGVAYVEPSDGDSIAYVVKRRVHFIRPSELSNDISFTHLGQTAYTSPSLYFRAWHC